MQSDHERGHSLDELEDISVHVARDADVVDEGKVDLTPATNQSSRRMRRGFYSRRIRTDQHHQRGDTRGHQTWPT
jgi:hypothetical protein